MRKNLLRDLTGWLDLILKSKCPLCDRSTELTLCQDCQRRVQRCQLANSEEFWQPPLPVLSWGNYAGALKQSIAVLKYNNHPQLARPLGHGLAEVWRRSAVAQANRLVVVPIPMHSTKQRERGFNQAELIARSFCERAGLLLEPRGLIRIRETEAQFSLSPAARAQNLAGAFQIGEGLSRRSTTRAVLLVDDIYTTGATAKAAAQVLRQHQISVYGMVVVAKAGAPERGSASTSIVS